MSQQNNPHIHIFRLGLRGWAAVGVGLLALLGVVVLALGLFVLFLPVLLLAPVLVYFLPRLMAYFMRKQARKNSTIIDGEFQVISTGEPEKNSNPRLRQED